MESKTLIISPIKDGSSARGIVTFFIEDELLKCKIRLYCVEKLTEFHRIGIYHQNQVYTANLLEKGGVYLSSFVGEFDLNQDFYVAIINTENDNEVLLAGGTYGLYFNNYSVFQNSNSEQEKIEETKTENENMVQCDDCDRCKNCKYKEYFYASKTESETLNQNENPPKNEEVDEKTVPTLKETAQVEDDKVYNVLNSIIPQFNYVFANYEHNEELNALIKGGKFVKIVEQNEEYSIGTIEIDGIVKYICYAVKAFYNSDPPAEIGKHYQWLPIDKSDPLTDGYFVVFQDAKDLKILEL